MANLYASKKVLIQRGVNMEAKWCSERQITFERCIIEYIWCGICRAFCMGGKLREKMEVGKRNGKFLVHFITKVHTPLHKLSS
jgi:hypothetical protein